LQESSLDVAPEASSIQQPDTGEEGGSGHGDRRRRKHRGDGLTKPKTPLWHFGIRSVAPPMEVMLEMYKYLQALGIEWREKRGPWIADAECCNNEDGFFEGPDLRGATKDDLDIYTIELRWRKRDIVVSGLRLA